MTAIKISKYFNCLVVLSCLIIVLSNILTVKAQTTVRILCDTTFDVSQTVREMPDIVYRTILPQAGQPVQQIERVTQTDTQVLDIPLPPELLGKVYPRRISPDGRYLALIPTEYGTPFTVWKLGSSEIATVILPDSDVDYLTKFIVPTSRQEKVLTWIDDSHLLIQYFDLDYSSFDHVLAEKVLTVVDTPFQFIDESRIDIPYPSLTAPSPSSFPRPEFSPQGRYVTLVSTFNRQRFQIYDNTSTEPILIQDLQSDVTRGLIYKPVWTLDEQQFFMLYRINPRTSPVRFGIAQVNVQQGFQIDNNFQQELETSFGPDMTVANPPIASLNDIGTYFILRIYAPVEQRAYLVFYEVATGNITAVCDSGIPSSDTYIPIWSPDNNHFAYWNNGWIIAYDLNTGQGYRTNGIGFIGWIAGD